MIVDVHHHYVDGSYYTEYTDFPAQLIEAMDRRGWDWTCLSGVGPRYHGCGNSEVARAIERFPDRIIGMGHLDPDRGRPGDVDELKRMGMRGLKVIGTLRRYDDDAYLPFYERAARERMPILFHTGFLGGSLAAGPRYESSDHYRPIMLDRIARLFPELPLIAAHMGTMVWFQEALAVMTHPNVYGDTSGGPGSMCADFYRMPLNDQINWDKALFGSDSLPNDAQIPFDSLNQLMEELGLSQATRRGILGETAAKIFGLTR